MMQATPSGASVGAPTSLAILVPALNEVDNLAATVERLLRAASLLIPDFEIIVVDDGSSDGTSELADELAAAQEQVRVIHNGRNMGLGYSYRRGIDVARKRYFVYIPGDNSWPYESFLRLFGLIGQADIVTSYATNPGVRGVARRVISSQYTRLLNRLFGHRMRYFNGLTVYPLAFLQRSPPSSLHFGFQAELLLRALHQGLSILEVGLPIDEHALDRSKALTGKNVVSVVATVLGMYGELKVVPRLLGQPAVPRGQHRVARPASERPTPLASERATPPVIELPAAPAAAPALHPTAVPPPADPQAPLYVVIAGASAGIGAALVEALAHDGHRVFACARRADRLAAMLERSPGALGRPCDVADEAQVREFAAWVRAQAPHVDALINCAGGFGAIGVLEATDSDEWWHTLRTNLFGVYAMTKHVLPVLAGAANPRILNFSGGGAFNPFPHYSAYACSKAAVVRLTECLAEELRPRGIAVNAIAPGFVATEIHQATLAAGVGLAGTAQYEATQKTLREGGARMETIVECVRYLLGPESRGLTGKTISANFDPWRSDVLGAHLDDVVESDLWTMRRINIVNLADSPLKAALADALASRSVGARNGS